ncbi:hypothetical protein [Jeotgalibacillus proteolyticus]|uniref:Uncharacterized protein n=1 Tax=Jeotgalibacillus proteolyticus TaxID=2082395 RepID=A0A2S5G7X9_9BACL|nr:hypothetical protein [Jeotgalibacillus proteolyticus]PPA69034.1 hypothetical protein C4B60_17100 [Jeotgalibacillus proteolyticus]
MEFIFSFDQLLKRVEERTRIGTILILSPDLKPDKNKKKWRYFGLASGLIVLYSVLLLLYIGSWLYLVLVNVQLTEIFAIVLTLLISFLPIMVILLLFIRYTFRLYPYSYNGIYSLTYPIISEEFQIWIFETQHSRKTVEEYIIPYLRGEIEKKNENPILTFVRKLLPSFMTYSKTVRLKQLEQVIYGYLIDADSPKDPLTFPPRKSRGRY